MFVNARKYVSGLINEKSVMPTSVRSLRTRAKLTTPERETERQTDRERDRDDNKAQGIVPHLFSRG
jgi:hypothetical protein